MERKEAIEVIKKNWPDSSFTMLREALEALIPELKESKDENADEKVRKALIKLVTNHASMDLFIEYDIHLYEALDWLEKKGEQNATWSEEDEEIHRKCICAMKASACGFPEEEKFVEQVDNWLKSIKERIHPKY